MLHEFYVRRTSDVIVVCENDVVTDDSGRPRDSLT